LQTYILDLFFKSASAQRFVPKKILFVLSILMVNYSLIIKLVHLFLLFFLSQKRKYKFATPLLRKLQTYILDLFFKSARSAQKVLFVLSILMLTYFLIIKLVYLFLLKFVSQKHKYKFATPSLTREASQCFAKRIIEEVANLYFGLIF
jgi:hypothetical protein